MEAISPAESEERVEEAVLVNDEDEDEGEEEPTPSEKVLALRRNPDNLFAPGIVYHLSLPIGSEWPFLCVVNHPTDILGLRIEDAPIDTLALVLGEHDNSPLPVMEESWSLWICSGVSGIVDFAQKWTNIINRANMIFGGIGKALGWFSTTFGTTAGFFAKICKKAFNLIPKSCQVAITKIVSIGGKVVGWAKAVLSLFDIIGTILRCLSCVNNVVSSLMTEIRGIDLKKIAREWAEAARGIAKTANLLKVIPHLSNPYVQACSDLLFGRVEQEAHQVRNAISASEGPLKTEIDAIEACRDGRFGILSIGTDVASLFGPSFASGLVRVISDFGIMITNWHLSFRKRFFNTMHSKAIYLKDLLRADEILDFREEFNDVEPDQAGEMVGNFVGDLEAKAQELAESCENDGQRAWNTLKQDVVDFYENAKKQFWDFIDMLKGVKDCVVNWTRNGIETVSSRISTLCSGLSRIIANTSQRLQQRTMDMDLSGFRDRLLQLLVNPLRFLLRPVQGMGVVARIRRRVVGMLRRVLDQMIQFGYHFAERLGIVRPQLVGDPQTVSRPENIAVIVDTAGEMISSDFVDSTGAFRSRLDVIADLLQDPLFIPSETRKVSLFFDGRPRGCCLLRPGNATRSRMKIHEFLDGARGQVGRNGFRPEESPDESLFRAVRVGVLHLEQLHRETDVPSRIVLLTGSFLSGDVREDLVETVCFAEDEEEEGGENVMVYEEEEGGENDVGYEEEDILGRHLLHRRGVRIDVVVVSAGMSRFDWRSFVDGVRTVEQEPALGVAEDREGVGDYRRSLVRFFETQSQSFEAFLGQVRSGLHQ